MDYGESFATGATREALEEAGIPVRLTGILRIEHTPGLGYAIPNLSAPLRCPLLIRFSSVLVSCRSNRLRVIYAAEPADDTPLKSIPDEEVIEAKWCPSSSLPSTVTVCKSNFFSKTPKGLTQRI